MGCRTGTIYGSCQGDAMDVLTEYSIRAGVPGEIR